MQRKATACRQSEGGIEGRNQTSMEGQLARSCSDVTGEMWLVNSLFLHNLTDALIRTTQSQGKCLEASCRKCSQPSESLQANDEAHNGKSVLGMPIWRGSVAPQLLVKLGCCVCSPKGLLHNHETWWNGDDCQANTVQDAPYSAWQDRFGSRQARFGARGRTSYWSCNNDSICSSSNRVAKLTILSLPVLTMGLPDNEHNLLEERRSSTTKATGVHPDDSCTSLERQQELCMTADTAEE